MPELALRSPVAARHAAYKPAPLPPDPFALLKRELATLRAELRTEKAERMALESSMARIWEKLRKVDAQLAEVKRTKDALLRPRTVLDSWRDRRCFVCGLRGRCEHREYDVDLALVEADERKRNARALDRIG